MSPCKDAISGYRFLAPKRTWCQQRLVQQRSAHAGSTKHTTFNVWLWCILVSEHCDWHLCKVNQSSHFSHGRKRFHYIQTDRWGIFNVKSADLLQWPTNSWCHFRNAEASCSDFHSSESLLQPYTSQGHLMKCETRKLAYNWHSSSLLPTFMHFHPLRSHRPSVGPCSSVLYQRASWAGRARLPLHPDRHTQERWRYMCLLCRITSLKKTTR